MSWGIDQVEDIFLPVTRLVYDTDCLGFDRDTTLPLQFHIVKDLRLHLTLSQRTSHFDNSVSKCRLAMVYMCNDTKITDFALIPYSRSVSILFPSPQRHLSSDAQIEIPL